MDARLHVKEAVIGVKHEKEQASESEQTEDKSGAGGKSEVLQEEKPADETAGNGDEEALFLDDRDALELIFRYALADEVTKRSAGTLLKRLFALRDTFARDAIVRVVKRFSKVRFGGGLLTLVKDKETAVVTVAQFVWIWDMLRFDSFDIGSYDNAGCTGLIKIAELFRMAYRECVNHIRIPELRELKYSTVETWSRRTVTCDEDCVPNTTHLVDQYPVSLDLALALIKKNVDTLKVLDGVPVWRLKEPLPALHLDRFVYQIGWPGPLSQDMGNLGQCTVEKFECCFKSFCDGARLPLAFLAGVRCEKIHWNLSGLYGLFHGFESPQEGQSNEHTRQLCIQANSPRHRDTFHLRALDIDAVRFFFPSLLRMDLHILAGHSACGWLVHNLVHFFARIQQFSQTLASAQGEFKLRLNVYVSFKHESEDYTKAATEKAIALGFTSEVANGSTIFKRQVEVATGRIVTAVCTVN